MDGGFERDLAIKTMLGLNHHHHHHHHHYHHHRHHHLHYYHCPSPWQGVGEVQGIFNSICYGLFFFLSNPNYMYFHVVFHNSSSMFRLAFTCLFFPFVFYCIGFRVMVLLHFLRAGQLYLHFRIPIPSLMSCNHVLSHNFSIRMLYVI